MQIRSRARTSYAQKKGKLHGSSLHRLMVKDAGGYSERIFKNKVDTNVLDVSIGILIDTSGSMSGEVYSHAMKAAVILNNVLGNILNIPTGIYGFSTYHNFSVGECTSIAEYRKFSDVRVSDGVLESSMVNFAAITFANNADGEAIAYTYDKLMQHKSKRHIMFVLSDGAPCASFIRGDTYSHTIKVVKAIEEAKRCEIYGIGIMDNNVERIYKKRFVIHSAEALEPCLLSLLDKTLI